MSEELDQLLNKVLFESDRTCCVCRDTSRPVQIHHIDGDHSNNARDNLAVACDVCHKLAHTTIPFSRNLNADQVRLYDRSWREICAARLLPETAAIDFEEYRHEVTLEISLACHHWKNDYMAIYPGHFLGGSGGFRDIWELLIETAEHADSVEEWNKYRQLFIESVNSVVAELHTILSCHSEAIPIPLKIQTMRTIRQLLVERDVFHTSGPSQTSVKMRIRWTLQTLANLARMAGSFTLKSPVVTWQE